MTLCEAYSRFPLIGSRWLRSVTAVWVWRYKSCCHSYNAHWKNGNGKKMWMDWKKNSSYLYIQVKIEVLLSRTLNYDGYFNFVVLFSFLLKNVYNCYLNKKTSKWDKLEASFWRLLSFFFFLTWLVAKKNWCVIKFVWVLFWIGSFGGGHSQWCVNAVHKHMLERGPTCIP